MTFSTNILLLYAFRFCTAALVLFAIIAILQLIQISKTPSDIPWVGLGNRKVFPKLRACLSELFVGRSMIDEGYEKVSHTKLQLHSIFDAKMIARSTGDTANHSSSQVCSGSRSFYHRPTPPGWPNSLIPSSAARQQSTMSWLSIISLMDQAQNHVETSQ